MTVIASDVRGLFEPAVLRNPYAVYDEWRRESPVRWDDSIESWVVTGYQECARVLQNTDDYCSDWRRIGEETPVSMLSIQTLDPPEHTTVRRSLLDAVHRNGVRWVDDLATAAVAGQLHRLDHEHPIDFVIDFAEPVALEVMIGFLGVPMPALEWFAPVSHRIVDAMDAGLRPKCFEPGLVARAELSALAESWTAAPTASGLLGELMSTPLMADTYRDVMLNTLRAALHAGFESTSRFLSGALLAILRLPRERRVDLRSGRALNELVRYVSPVQADSRGCVQDTMLGDQVIRRGEIVTLLLGAANRDPDSFADPGNVLLDRADNHHLGFGRGAHACIGSSIALSVAKATFAAVQERHPHIRVVAEPEYRPNATLRGLDRLLVAL